MGKIKLAPRTLDQLATSLIVKRPASMLHSTRRQPREVLQLFQSAGVHDKDVAMLHRCYQHRGSDCLRRLLHRLNENGEICKVILQLASPVEYDGSAREHARKKLNDLLLPYKYEVTIEPNATEPVLRRLEKVDLSRATKDASSSPSVIAIILPDRISDGEVKQSLEFWNAEYQKCAKARAYLASVVLLGAMLEAALLLALKKRLKDANQCPSAPKQRGGKDKALGDWTLSEMIDVACARGWIGKYAQSAGHGLRDYRNFIHANKLMQENEKPDQGLVAICSRTVQKALDDLAAKGLLE